MGRESKARSLSIGGGALGKRGTASRSSPHRCGQDFTSSQADKGKAL
jgi:hypothetical protein